MSKTRKVLTQRDANDAIESLRLSGYSREQLIEAFNQQFPERRGEEEYLSKEVADLSLEDIKLDRVAASKLDGSNITSNMRSSVADKKETNDFYIDPEDLLENDEEPLQHLPIDQRTRGNSKDSESSTETIVGEKSGSSRSKARFSLGTKTATLGDRGRTVSGPQVEHALAYVAYESIAKKAIAGQKISEAAGKIVEAFAAFPISEQAIEEMQERLSELAQEAMRFRTAKRSLKAQKEANPNFLPETDYNASHDALKIAARAEYAKMISSAMDTCLLGANKMPNVSYPTEGFDPNPNTGKEKEAKNNLLLLNSFLGRVTQTQDGTDLLGDPEFLKMLEKKWGISAEQVNSIFVGSETEDFDLEDQLNDIILPVVQAQLNQHMSELFYYPNLQETYRYPIKVKVGREEFLIEKDWAVSRDEWQDVMKTIPETGERIAGKPKYNKGTLPRSNDLDEMVKTVGQAQVGFAHMLPELALFGQRNYRAIMEGFLINSVINNSRENGGKGWGDTLRIASESENPVEWLSRNIQERAAKIDYELPLNSRLNNSLASSKLLISHNDQKSEGRV